MKLSVVNQLAGRVSEVSVGDVMSRVRVQVGQDQITAAIESGAARPLGLTPGSSVHVLVGAEDVWVAVEPVQPITVRNTLPGMITALRQGPVVSTIDITLRDGQVLVATVARQAADELDLREGTSVTALVQSTKVDLVAQ